MVFTAAEEISRMLKCPETGGPVVFRDGAFESVESPGVRFPVEDGIIRAFLPDGGDLKGDVTDVIKAFYEETPFPSYDEMETPGSLIEKSLDRVFPDMLNRSIPPHTKVLEVGCGTGQLGNFLSIADRKVLSVDMCLNSLRQAQNFKEKNGFDNVSFAQMNLFRMPLQAEYFDVVICTGVLHHTGFPEKGFRGLVPLVRPGGHIIIGLYNLYGRLKTRARRVLFGLIGERYASLDPYISRFGATGEKLHSWFMDQYKNPHESYHTMDEVLRWFRENGIIFLRGLPGTVFGSGFEMDYRASLFEPEPPGTGMDRFLSQVNQMLTDTEGGLFIMIGRKE